MRISAVRDALRKRSGLAIFLACALVGAVFAAAVGIGRPDPGDAGSISPDVVALVRNASWNTSYVPSVPFQKGNTVEYSYILRLEKAGYVRLGIDRLRAYVDVSSVELDGKPVDASRPVLVPLASTLTIRGQARVSSDETTPSPRDIVSILPDASIATPVGSGSSTVIDDRSRSPAPSATGSQNAASAPVVPTRPDVSFYLDDAPLGGDPLDPLSNTLLELRGKDAASVERVVLGDHAVAVKQVSGVGYVPLEAATFTPGQYFVVLQFAGGQLRTTDRVMTFADTVNQSVRITGVTPREVDNSVSSANIVLQGAGFSRIVSVQLNNTYILRNTEFRIINDQVLVVSIPTGLDSGEYFFNIMLPNSISSFPKNPFRIISPSR